MRPRDSANGSTRWAFSEFVFWWPSLAFESSRGGEEKTWSLPCRNSLAPTKSSTARPGPGKPEAERDPAPLNQLSHQSQDAPSIRYDLLNGWRVTQMRLETDPALEAAVDAWLSALNVHVLNDQRDVEVAPESRRIVCTTLPRRRGLAVVEFDGRRPPSISIEKWSWIVLYDLTPASPRATGIAGGTGVGALPRASALDVVGDLTRTHIRACVFVSRGLLAEHVRVRDAGGRSLQAATQGKTTALLFDESGSWEFPLTVEALAPSGAVVANTRFFGGRPDLTKMPTPAIKSSRTIINGYIFLMSVPTCSVMHAATKEARVASI